MTEPTDGDLVARARIGDREAFDCLIRRYHLLAVRVAFRAVPHREAARELAQEALLRAYLSLGSLREGARFGSWLHGIVLNVCRGYLRAGRAATPEAPFPWGMFPDPEDPDPRRLAEERELHAGVRHAVETLPAHERGAALRFYYEGQSLREIARELGISVQAVKSRLHQARKRLRERLAPLYPELAALPKRTTRRKGMIPVTIADVVERPDPGHDPGSGYKGHVVVLHDAEGKRVLPIWIGLPEATAIAMGLRRIRTARPMTYSFVTSLLGAAGLEVEQVRISSLSENVFYAVVRLRSGETSKEVDARPSDALALASHCGCPVFVSEAVLEAGGAPVPGDLADRAPAGRGAESLLGVLPGMPPGTPPSDEAIRRSHQELVAAVFRQEEESEEEPADGPERD